MQLSGQKLPWEEEKGSTGAAPAKSIPPPSQHGPRKMIRRPLPGKVQSQAWGQPFSSSTRVELMRPILSLALLLCTFQPARATVIGLGLDWRKNVFVQEYWR